MQVAAGLDRLYQGQVVLDKWSFDHSFQTQVQLQAVRSQTLEGTDREHGSQQDVYRAARAQRDKLLAQLTAAITQTLDGLEREYVTEQTVSGTNTAQRDKLFGQIESVARTQLEGVEREHGARQTVQLAKGGHYGQLFGQLQAIATQVLAGIDKQHGVEQDVSRTAATQRDTLLSQLQKATQMVLDGQARYDEMTLRNAEFEIQARQQLCAKQMEADLQRLQAIMGTHQEQQQLMKYQIDERSKIAIGLFGFMERRTDGYPDLSSFAQLTQAFGDAGATSWVAP